MSDEAENGPRGEENQDNGWEREEEATHMMSKYEKLAVDAMTGSEPKTAARVADFDLGGAVPRQEPANRPFQSKDIYVRLENTIYGPITQDELSEMLESGHLTGFESASADLRHWTPLIYHPRMTLSGEIDPDATHELLHGHSTLPTASRAPNAVDLEALADLDDDAPLPGTPLAAILIRPMRVSRKTGLPLPVHADLAEESIDRVIQRTEISDQQAAAGAQAIADLGIVGPALDEEAASRLALPDDAEEIDPDVPDRAAVARADTSGAVELDIEVDVVFVNEDGVETTDEPDAESDDEPELVLDPEVPDDIDLEAALDSVGADERAGDDDEPRAGRGGSERSGIGGFLIGLIIFAIVIAAVYVRIVRTTPSPGTPAPTPIGVETTPESAGTDEAATGFVALGSGEAPAPAVGEGSAVPTEGSAELTEGSADGPVAAEPTPTGVDGVDP